MKTDEIPEELTAQLRFYAEHVEELGTVETPRGPGTRGTEALVAEGLTQAADEIERLNAMLAGIEAGRGPLGLLLWQGLCGHHWLKAEIEDCPVCAASSVIAPGGDDG